ncbi:MAG: hypothetical protein CMF70_10945 [Magnetovibrio sp.]|nr:hypothetical protein [Magnetovibrio sp.]
MEKDELDAEFDKADKIIASTMEKLIDEDFNQYVYGMAFLELGLAALTRVGESNDSIEKTVNELLVKINRIHLTGYSGDNSS